MNTRIYYMIGIVFVLNMLHLSGCVTPQKQKLPEFLPVAEGDIPGDAKLVAAAVHTRITGYEISKILGVSFKEGAETYNAEINQATHAELNQAVDSHEGQ